MGEVGGVGVGQVAEQPLDLDVGAPRRGLQQRLRRVPVHPDALHPRVDLEVDLGACPSLGRARLDGRQLVDARGRQGHVVGEVQRDLVAQDAAHHQDGRGDALAT